jgi:hypothetical protein
MIVAELRSKGMARSLFWAFYNDKINYNQLLEEQELASAKPIFPRTDQAKST